MQTTNDLAAMEVYADRLEAHLQCTKFDTLLAHDIKGAVAWLRRAQDGWRTVATDPPPVGTSVLYQNENGQVSYGQFRDLKYHSNPERVKNTWTDSRGYTMPAPLLWQPLPEPRKL